MFTRGHVLNYGVVSDLKIRFAGNNVRVKTVVRKTRTSQQENGKENKAPFCDGCLRKR